jgi:hypothetical protein
MSKYPRHPWHAEAFQNIAMHAKAAVFHCFSLGNNQSIKRQGDKTSQKF